MGAIDNLALSLHLTEEEKDWMTSKAIVQKLRQAVHSLNAVKRDAAELREGHLEAMAKLSSSLHRMSEAAASAAIATRGKASKQYCHLRRTFKMTSASGLERIDVPNIFTVL